MSSIKVGRRVYYTEFVNDRRVSRHRDPKVEGYTSILCLTLNTPYGDIGPYGLSLEAPKGLVNMDNSQSEHFANVKQAPKGLVNMDNSQSEHFAIPTLPLGNVIMENRWQFCKVYYQVPESTQYISKNNKTIIWQHPEEIHVDGECYLNEKWFTWCLKGMFNKTAIRYPVGFNARHECLGCVPNDLMEKIFNGERPKIHTSQLLQYIDSRKQIYAPIYASLVAQTTKFKQLQERLKKGEKLLIIEVDGPHSESLAYYQENYHVKDDFIVKETIDVTPENLSIMVNDKKHPYGHGYVLAWTLLTS
jgi:hypothetical protein